MLDIIDIRRNQVMMEGEFPVQLAICISWDGAIEQSLGN